MYIDIDGEHYELFTKLGIALAIEKRFKAPLTSLFDKINTAEVPELLDIIAIAAKKEKDSGFKEELLNAWDYTDLLLTVTELIVRMMFAGSADQTESKLEKLSMGETQKNAMRTMLGLPVSTGQQSSELDTALV